MKKIFTFLFLMLIVTITVMSQPVVQSQQLLGGTGNENLYGYSNKPTSDGGAILCGNTNSSNTGTFTGLTNNGGLDGVLIKLDASGNTTLQKIYGGSSDDELDGIRQTSDGGYIAVGDASSSNSGTLTGITNNGGKDGWVMKLNSTGGIVWQKLLGGSGDDYLFSARQTADGGYIISGQSTSSNSGTLAGITNNGGTDDGWILKLDANGNTVWQKLLGGSSFDRFIESAPTNDGGYIAVGTATGSSGTLTGVTSYGGLDGWIIKFDASGNTVWQKLYGGGSDDQFGNVEQTTDGGYITALAAANVNSVNGTYTKAGYGQYDGWVVKTDALGNLQWQQLLGTSSQDFFDGVQLTSDGGYILSGQASSGAQNPGSLTGLTFNGGYDGWIVKLNGAGDVQWQELLGGTLDDNLFAVQETSDGGYFASGYTSSSNTGTLTGLTSNGGADGWTVKLAPYVAPKLPGSGNGLLFDNTKSQYVDIGYGYDPSGSFSFETWIKRTSLAVTDPNAQSFIAGVNDNGWGVGINQSSPANTIYLTKIGVSEVTSTSTISDTNWHHVAVTFDAVANMATFYIDGVADAPVSYNPGGFTSGTPNYYRLGGRNNGTNVNYLNGRLDEIRIWNGVVLTQAEIRGWMCRKVTPTHPEYNNLLSYFKFDEGTGDTTYSTDGHLGSLANAPTWLTSGASIGDTSAYDYTNATKTATITATSGESFKVTNTAGAPAGLQVYRVDTIPNTTNGANSGGNNKYFGVFQIGGTTPTYTAVYNYNGNPLVIPSSENMLGLFKRHDNSVTSWTDCGAALNTTNKTLTTTGQSTEYILGVTSGTLPVSLINFAAYKQNATVKLSWQSQNEISFSRYDVEKSKDGISFTSIGTVNALHGSLTNTYSLIDNAPAHGYNFYRLKQINADGQFTYSKIIKVDFSKQLLVTITPNPARDYLNFNTSDLIKEIRLLGLDGKVINKWTNISGITTLNISNLAAGVYIVKMITANEVLSQKIIKE
ncbi:MAG: LamG-like jellyroll fold domain-containing protein [Ginsengibacter sp.]